MTDPPDAPGYDDLIDADDVRLLPVIHDLEQIYQRGHPPAHVLEYVRIEGAKYPPASPRSRTWPFWPSPASKARFPAGRVLVLAATVIVSLLGGVAYATHTHLLGDSQPHLVSSCAGTALSIADPAYKVSSPQDYAASGGSLVPEALKQAAALPHVQYWVVPADAVLVNTCVRVSVNQTIIGRDDTRGTELRAMSIVPFGQATTPWSVGYLSVPARGGCLPHSTSLPVHAPDDRPVAQLEPVPAGFSNSADVAWTPCDPHEGSVRTTPVAPPPQLDGEPDDVSFQVLSQISYRGPEGAITVITIRPSATALKPGLNLGNPAGTLHDGTAVFEQTCGGDCPEHMVQWLQNGLIVSVSGDVPMQRLRDLAEDVHVSTTR